MVGSEELHAVKMRQNAVVEVIDSSVSDLRLLMELNELDAFLITETTASRDTLAGELASFLKHSEIYDQIRILSPTGMQLLRVDRREGNPVVAATTELTFEGDHGFFREMADRPVGLVYVSRTVLRIKDETAVALNPTVGIGIGLVSGDDLRAYVVLDLLGSVVLGAYTDAISDALGQSLLVDQNGAWLFGRMKQAEVGVVLPDPVDEELQNRFASEWERISSTASGQFETGNGLFSYDTLILYDVANAGLGPFADTDSSYESSDLLTLRNWKNVSWVPATSLGAVRRSGAAQLAIVNIFGVLLLGSFSWFFSRWFTQRGELHKRTLHERDALSSTLHRYVPQEVTKRLLGDPERHAGLGGESQEVAVLFVDIRGFTRFAESHEPEDVVAVLNRTLTVLTEPLRVFDGVLDKYTGDGFLAFFETTSGLEDAAQRAVSAAQAMQQVFRNLWQDAPAETLRDLGLGVGISTGRVIVGNVGSESAMNYTVVGDTVNVAARLEGLAKAGDILVSDPVYSLLDDKIPGELMRSTKLRGRREPINVYRLTAE